MQGPAEDDCLIIRPLSNNNDNKNNDNNTLMISNVETEDIIRIVKSLEDSGLLLKGATEKWSKRTKRRIS